MEQGKLKMRRSTSAQPTHPCPCSSITRSKEQTPPLSSSRPATLVDLGLFMAIITRSAGLPGHPVSRDSCHHSSNGSCIRQASPTACLVLSVPLPAIVSLRSTYHYRTYIHLFYLDFYVPNQSKLQLLEWGLAHS